ncbi:MAG TPA: type II secretion system F family protein [Solirubrobacteraceae bacterium]|jgi:tight adherence protein B|nr:type II secretion system F family protein [Solirubrobacteraceae bacterium]
MSPGASVFAIVISVAAALLIGFAVLMLLTRNVTVADRVSDYVTLDANDSEAGLSLIERALGDKQTRTIVRSPFITRLRIEMEVADLKFGPEQLMVLTLLITVLVGWLLATSTHSPIAAVLAVSVPFVANFAIRALADRQRRLFSEQLPDNLQVIASAMRAGQTFVGALKAVIEDAPEPSRRELRRAVMDEELGVPLVDALGHVTERMKSEDFQHVAIVASLQRDTGGNTAEVVDLVSETVRERIEIRRMVRGLTAQGRLSGGVLSLLPVGLLMLISLLNPTYVHPLFHTTVGLIGLGVGVGLVVTGALVMRKIIDIKI